MSGPVDLHSCMTLEAEEAGVEGSGGVGDDDDEEEGKDGGGGGREEEEEEEEWGVGEGEEEGLEVRGERGGGGGGEEAVGAGRRKDEGRREEGGAKRAEEEGGGVRVEEEEEEEAAAGAEGESAAKRGGFGLRSRSTRRSKSGVWQVRREETVLSAGAMWPVLVCYAAAADVRVVALKLLHTSRRLPLYDRCR